MKVSELKLNQEVFINGYTYAYQGVQKLRKPGFGTMEKIVFKGKDIDDEKHFNINVLGKELKNKNGFLEFK